MSQQWLANPASMEWPAGSDGRVEEYMATFLAKGWVATGPGRTYETWVGKLAAFLLKSFGVTGKRFDDLSTMKGSSMTNPIV